MRLVTLTLLGALLCSSANIQAGVTNAVSDGFVHPGLSHKSSDLERMKYMVAQGKEPWISTYTRLSRINAYASCDYQVRGDTSMTILDATGSNYDKFKYDGLAAYQNALMWAISGEECHAQKAVEIFNAWVNLKGIKSGGTRSLDAGRVIWKMLEGAEIIRHTYEGWRDDDIAKFSAMLVYPGYSMTEEPTEAIQNQQVTFYWYMYNGDPGRHGNQGLFGMRGLMAMGIFLDNSVMYQRALRYVEGLPHLSQDLPYPAGPRLVSTTPKYSDDYYDEYATVSPYVSEDATVDYGFNEQIDHYIWKTGQSQESSRDQGHVIDGVSILMTMAEMAWNQGDDLYGFLDNRILLGLEYYYKYNLSYQHTYDDQPTPWEPTVENGEFIQQRDRSGRWFSKQISPWQENGVKRNSRGEHILADKAPVQEMALGHYQDRMGLDAADYLWTKRSWQASIDELGYFERSGTQVDFPGWGGLTERRAALSPGDPVQLVNGKLTFATHVIPGSLEAENYDYFASGGQGRTYKDQDTENKGGQYRLNEGVDIDQDNDNGHFYVTDIQSGEWLSYTIYLEKAASYDVVINYRASKTGSKMQFELNGQNITDAISLPVTDAQGWSQATLATGVPFTAGVQRLRVLFTGTDNTLELDQITVE